MPLWSKNPRGNRWLYLASLGATGLFFYFVNLGLLNRTLIGWEFGPWTILSLSACCFLLTQIILRRFIKNGMVVTRTLQGLALSTLVSVGCILILDVSYSAYIDTSSTSKIPSNRSRDPNTWPMELYPRVYYPTDRNFKLFKPSVQVSGGHYGQFYAGGMLKSPTLERQVLSRKYLTVSIDQVGFRESTPIEQAKIFTLGDSFTFGWAVKDEEAWNTKLEHALQEPVYNLGIHNTSPKQQVELLKYLFDQYGDDLGVTHVLWLIYEGNDLEDSYEELNPEVIKAQAQHGFFQRMNKKLGQVLTDFKKNTAIQKLRKGHAKFVFAEKSSTGQDPYKIDEIQLTNPLYFSDSLGPRIFSERYLQQAMKPKTYVMDHPNRPRLDQVFHEMQELAKDRGFIVTVILAPTAVRVHGPYYKGFPSISQEPFFLQYVRDLASSSGFKVLDLYEYLSPLADNHLLYFRDDDHWNPEGHSVVADAIIHNVFENQMALAPSLSRESTQN